MPENGRLDEVRQEIIQLLRMQLEALADLSGLSDAQLTACYQRQERVRELRNQLTLGMELEPEDSSVSGHAPTSLPGNPEAVVAGF